MIILGREKLIKLVTNTVIILSLLLFFTYNFGFLGVNLKANLSFVLIGAVILLAIREILVYKDRESNLLEKCFALLSFLTISYLVLLGSQAIWPYFILCLLVFEKALIKGKKYGLIIFALGLVVSGGDLFIDGISKKILLDLGVVYIIQIALLYLGSILYTQNRCNERELESRHQKIEEMTKDINSKLDSMTKLSKSNEELECANKRLEITNQKLNKSAAEYYTLQQISQAIATILDIEELLKFINDVIIGVMGVNNSTILLIDKSTNSMHVNVTNIDEEEALRSLRENINCELLNNVADTGKPILLNCVSSKECLFLGGRDVKSILCVPLSRKNEKFGLVLVEQERLDAFEDNHLKLLLSISNQMSVALENVSLYERMQRMATIDALTNIYNRLYFNEVLAKEMAQADQNNYSMSVSIFDIDHFKKFNDTYGHLFGDLVLKTIARLAKDHMKEHGTVARFGGEEFVIIMPNTNEDGALKIIEELREKISKLSVNDGSVKASVTASFGIACYPKNGSSEAEVLSAADTALYKAKTEGRNCTRIYSN